MRSPDAFESPLIMNEEWWCHLLPSAPMIELLLMEILPERLVFLHLGPELHMLEQIEVMECVWIAAQVNIRKINVKM